MFLRVVRAAGGNGVTHEYVRLVEAFRDENGKTQHRTIVNLGRKDLLREHLDLEKLTRLLHGEKPDARETKGDGVGAIGAWDWLDGREAGSRSKNLQLCLTRARIRPPSPPRARRAQGGLPENRRWRWQPLCGA